MSHPDCTSFAALLAGLLLLAVPVTAWSGGEAATTTAAEDPAMPAMLRLAVIRSRAGEAGSAYHIDGSGRGTNPRHGLTLAFTPAGAQIEGGDGGFALRLERFGRGDGRPVRRAAPRIDGAWVEYDRGAGLSEWFVNLPRGVEQGWTVAERPAGGGLLMLELDTARPPEDGGNQRLAWSGLVYHRLVALDAGGRKLPATWMHEGARLRVVVDDREATYPVLIDPWVQQAKLTADDGEAGDELGISVAVSGDTALVGAWQATAEGDPFRGAAYVFTEGGGEWSQQARLSADDGAANDQFGFSVAISGDTALVGAPIAIVDGNLGRGAAYVFTESGGAWSQQDKLTANDGAPFDRFGASVAVSGDTALVAATRANVDGTSDQGAAYVFTRSGDIWSEQAKLTAVDGAEDDEFGISVGLAADIALVGAWHVEGDNPPDQGAAYVFIRSGTVWSQQARLTADDASFGDHFGYAVALAGDTALVGADEATVGDFQHQGAAYVFTRSGAVWSQQAKLTADDGTAEDRFGSSVALAGDTALVGARFAGSGAAYFFTRSGDLWSQQAKLVADDGAAGDELGISVAIAGDIALVGARGADVDGNGDQGAAYVFAPAEPELGFEPPQLDFGDVAIGVTSPPQTATLANTGDADATGLGLSLSSTAFAADTGGCGATLPAGQSCEVSVTFTPITPGAAGATLTAASTEGAGAELGLAGQGVSKQQVFSPVALVADPQAGDLSDGNQVFEPGERVRVAPAWRNDGQLVNVLNGTASNFSGPPGPDYILVADGADYGEVESGASASCMATGMCYEMSLGPPGIPRPTLHWDAVFDEALSDETARAWTLHIGDSFADVPRSSLFYPAIETLLHSGITGGCTPGAEAADPSLRAGSRATMSLGPRASAQPAGRGPDLNAGTDGRDGARPLQAGGAAYCPGGVNTRGQMPVFVLRALLGPEFTPEPCAEGDERFDDVPAGHLFCPWIEELAARGVVAGCGGGNYCPNSPVTRAQMAIFLLRTLEGPDFTPPECSGVFADVDCPSIFADWVEELFNRGVTGGCDEAPLRYCPSAPNARGQMAVFLSKTFGLTLYGP